MPMVGVIDPSHYERSHDKPGRLPHWLDMEELYLDSQAPNPKWSPWTFELVKAALGEHQERGDRISTTTIVAACPRSTVLERTEDYIGSLDNVYAALRGTMVHRTLESYTRLGAIPEARFFVTIDGYEISCSPDLVTEDTIYDYKVPTDQSGVPSFGYPFRHQTEQLMLNAFILRHAERWETADGEPNGALPFDPRENPVKHAVIVYLGPKGPKIIEYEKKDSFVTPAGITKEGKRPYVWSDKEVLEEFRPRLHIMANALRDYPAWPADWEDPATGTVHTALELWGGSHETWDCPGRPVCKLPDCLARRRPGNYVWPRVCRGCSGSGRRGHGTCTRCAGSGKA